MWAIQFSVCINMAWTPWIVVFMVLEPTWPTLVFPCYPWCWNPNELLWYFPSIVRFCGWLAFRRLSKFVLLHMMNRISFLLHYHSRVRSTPTSEGWADTVRSPLFLSWWWIPPLLRLQWRLNHKTTELIIFSISVAPLWFLFQFNMGEFSIRFLVLKIFAGNPAASFCKRWWDHKDMGVGICMLIPSVVIVSWFHDFMLSFSSSNFSHLVFYGILKSLWYAICSFGSTNYNCKNKALDVIIWQWSFFDNLRRMSKSGWWSAQN